MIAASQVEPWIEGLLRDARAAGAIESEVFFKHGRGRRVVLEPGPRSEDGARREDGRRLTVSNTAEEGAALRLRDREGRWGFAWGTRFSRRAAMDLVEAALHSARRFRDRRASAESAGAGAVDAAAARPGAVPMARRVEDLPHGSAAGAALGILDPQVLAEPAERVAGMLLAAEDAAASLAGGSAEVDRALLSEAVTTVILMNSHGFFGTYEKSLALLSVAMVPAVPGATAALEERSSCSLSDLEPRECGLEAARRALPPRPAIAPPPGEHPILLGARATASLLSSLVSWILSGRAPAAGLPAGSGRIGELSSLGRLTIVDDGRRPGAIGTTPFDGAGHPTGTTMLVEGGRVAGTLSERGGNIIRHSFRDLPALGPGNLLIRPDAEGISSPAAGLHLRAASVQVVPGIEWRVRVLKGEWYRDNAPIGSADGIAWEGSLERLLDGVAEVGPDLRFYHLGLPLGAPSLRIHGIAPWVVEGAGYRAAVRALEVARETLSEAPG